ncbi:MAG: DUF1553 domain-containing protein [Bacteroidetes bacterium]|nr:DUF1553 domain-containing protein [Bacteroidota bacterium]MDA1122356.1 DUF1553 domain-containing protein [Bacteroidota bacterium]
MPLRLCFILCLALLLSACGPSLPDEVATAYENLPEDIDFNFHIKPILSDRCYKCHGPDENARKADLRFDLEAGAFSRLKESGGQAFVKGNIAQSVAWNRIISHDLDFQMPPPESNLNLSAKEKALITKWIEEGAEWKEHWAFIAPEKPAVPTVMLGEVSKTEGQLTYNPIDNFVLAKLKEQGLSPSPEADKERLIRRVTFDLTGLPPTLSEIEEFLSDASTQAYENLVDRLLTTDAHAERMAMEWMDVARYADSHGWHADGLREMWPWRDWVIRAFKANLPYNEFVAWQIAGDLLPQSNREQKLATGFQRNHSMSGESGIVSKEYRLKYVADRTNTIATAFMGLTMECASCHDHKFDPVSQKEYYQLTAFFNNVHELGVIGNDKNFGPTVLLPTTDTEKKLSELSEDIDQVKSHIQIRKSEVIAIKKFVDAVKSHPIKLPEPDGYYPLESISSSQTRGGKNNQVLDNNPKAIISGTPEVIDGKKGNAVRLDSYYDGIFFKEVGEINLDEPLSAGAWLRIDDIEKFQTIMGNIGDKNSGWRGWIFYFDPQNRPVVRLIHSRAHNYLHIISEEPVTPGQWTHVFFTYDGSATADGLHIYVNGSKVKHTVGFDRLYKSIIPVVSRSYEPNNNPGVRMGKGPVYLYNDTDDGVINGDLDEVRIYHQYLTSLEVSELYRKEDSTSTNDIRLDSKDYLDHYMHRIDEPSRKLNQQLAKLRREKFGLLAPVNEVMVMEEMSMPRRTHILERGQYDAPGQEVFPSTPEAILPFPDNLPKNRLGLAQWLFDDKHPLTARVAVNRYWQMIFGRGIVETAHDFGSQGALPSHPELLDWLAIEFRESDWDLRALLKMMVTSATYRQSSIASADKQREDVKNIYLSRAPNYRLQAEMIRDNALATSGLLNRKIGGVSVKPYQPSGLWIEKNEFSGFLKVFVQDSGESLYRRSMYTFIRRTSPPPMMSTFDAPDREVCIMKRESTNTPLQALVLLNDPQFVEAARVLAERIQKEGGQKPLDQTTYAFRLVTGRMPSSTEVDLLMDQYQTEMERFKNDPESALELLQVGEHPFDKNLDETSTAALAMVASTLINHDEAYMKR